LPGATDASVVDVVSCAVVEVSAAVVVVAGRVVVVDAAVVVVVAVAPVVVAAAVVVVAPPLSEQAANPKMATASVPWPKRVRNVLRSSGSIPAMATSLLGTALSSVPAVRSNRRGSGSRAAGPGGIVSSVTVSILLAEDSFIVREGMRMLLEDAGYAVVAGVEDLGGLSHPREPVPARGSVAALGVTMGAAR